MASQLIRSLWDGNEPIELTGAPHLERAALELMASAYSQFQRTTVDRSSLSTIQRRRATEYIEQHLHDPELTPTSVASALRISRRYLHRMFDDGEETVSRYILRRRLERSAELLSDPLYVRRYVGDIGYSCGFSTVAHFCRTFREHYHLPPGAFREQAVSQLAASAAKPSLPSTG